MKKVFIATLAVIAALVAMNAFTNDAFAQVNARRQVAAYYNEMSGATTIYFRQTTSETTYQGSSNWMVRNPSTTVSLVLLTGSSTTTGLTIPPGATLSGNSYQNNVKLYSASSTPVELYYEAEER